MADIAALLNAMHAQAGGTPPPAMPSGSPMDPSMGSLGQGAPVDPTVAGSPAPLAPGAGAGGAGAYPSTDPGMIAQAVQACLQQLAGQDQNALGSQQAQAAAMAQPIIDQMLAQAAPQPAADPSQAFGEGPMPVMPPQDMAG